MKQKFPFLSFYLNEFDNDVQFSEWVNDFYTKK